MHSKSNMMELIEKAKQRLEKVKILIKENTLSLELAEKYSTEATEEFLSMTEHNKILLENIETLIQLGLHSNQKISEKAASCLFGEIIFKLKNSFQKEKENIILKIFPKIIISAKEKSFKINKLLEESQISLDNPEKDLYDASIRLREKRIRLSSNQKSKIKKIFILSRVTFGADIAITSILIKIIIP